MKYTEDKCESHPNKLDRNRAILLCRDLLNVNDWVILACKSSRLSGAGVPGDARELSSIAVIGPGERVLMDVVVQPDGAVSSELMQIHGSDSAHVFNAYACTDVHKILRAGFAKSRVICWNAARVKDTLSKLCRLAALPELQANYVDLGTQFSSFVGESAEGVEGYRQQALPQQVDSESPCVGALCECKFLLEIVNRIAGSSQISEALAFNKNWSAAFYKPKVGPTQKIKEILGLKE